jgi:hypothetical protein
MSRRIRTFFVPRCVDGRLMQHDPRTDNHYRETDVGQCPKCEGDGCGECDVCGRRAPLTKCWPMGIETHACDECRGEENTGD